MIRTRLLRLPTLITLALASQMAMSARAAPNPPDVRKPAEAASAPDVDATAVEGGLVPMIDAAALSEPTKLCGWWDNPTPGNVWLHDRSGEWTIAMQGMHEAKGSWPDFKPGEQLPVGTPHGYGCACITARVDRASRFVYSFTDAKALPPKVCRADPGLKRSGFK